MCSNVSHLKTQRPSFHLTSSLCRGRECTHEPVRMVELLTTQNCLESSMAVPRGAVAYQKALGRWGLCNDKAGARSLGQRWAWILMSLLLSPPADTLLFCGVESSWAWFVGSYGVVVFIEVWRQKMLILSISIQELEMLARIGKDQKETEAIQMGRKEINSRFTDTGRFRTPAMVANNTWKMKSVLLQGSFCDQGINELLRGHQSGP